MTDLLKKLALSMLLAQLNDPATKAKLHKYINDQINGAIDTEANKVDGAANQFLKLIASELKNDAVKAELDSLVDAEFDALLQVVVSKLA